MLREGTKTIFPVAYEEAVKIFDKLVESKTKKGYSENQASATAPAPKPEKEVVNGAREETILKYLKQATVGTYTRNWKLSRVILRAGHLNIKAAAPLIAHFIDAEDEFEQYAAINALAQLGSADFIKAVLVAFVEDGFDGIVGRIAAAYILRFGSQSQQSQVTKKALAEMPAELKQTARNADEFLNASHRR